MSMRRWVYGLTLTIMLTFFLLGKILVANQMIYPVTVSFLLMALILFSNITLQSYKSGVILKEVEYFYFFSVSLLMTLVSFFILTKNLTYSTFDNFYFYEFKYMEVILYTFALYLVKAKNKDRLFYTLFTSVLVIDIYLVFSFFNIDYMRFIPGVMFLELYIMYWLIANKRVKSVIMEVFEYTLISEVFFYMYLDSGEVSLYTASLFLFLASIFRLLKFFNGNISRDYFKTQYVKEKKNNKLLKLNDKAILILHGYTIKKANKSSLDLFGLKNIGDIRNQNLFNFISAKELGGYNFEKTLSEGQKRVIIRRNDGKEIKRLVNIHRIKGIREGEYILEFKEEANFGEFFYELNDKLENVIYIYEESIGYKYVSKGVERLLGYKVEEFYEDKWFTRKISLDSRFENLLKDQEESSSFTAKYKKRNGEVVYLKENVKKVTLGERKFYYGVVTEVTEFIDEVSKVTQLNEDLEEKNKKKDMAMSIVSHEIRTPITAIIGFLENILINNHKLDESTFGMIKKVFSNSIRLKELVNNLLDLNKLNAGKLELYPEKNDIKALVDEIILNNETLIEIKNLKCINQLEEKVDIYCDSSMLYQIVNNVISNSIKYNKERGKIIVSKEENSKELILKIQDDGVGIPEENKEKVFMEYERVRGIKEKGTGLGLPLAKKLIELNNGKIWFNSEVEKGTTFYLLFKKA